MAGSDYSGLYKLSRADRLAKLVAQDALTPIEKTELLTAAAEKYNLQAESFVENAIGCFPLPLGLVIGCLINNELVNVPLAIEETSVVAGLNKAAKLFREHGGVVASQDSSEVFGQMYLGCVADLVAAQKIIADNTDQLLCEINGSVFAEMKLRGGGANKLEFRILDGNIAVLHLYCDTCDAMGANLINMALEIIKPKVEDLLGTQVGACIVSNLNDCSLTKARVVLSGIDAELIDKIVELSEFAQLDPYRAATHNKGIMNGMDGVLIATGNDWRAVEAGVHAYAAQGGKYKGVSVWYKNSDGSLVGELVAPISLGVVGGVTKAHDLAQLALKIMKIKTAKQLSSVVAAVGLMQNFSALLALSSKGIVQGHMLLHINNLILSSGASVFEQDALRSKLEKTLVSNKKVTLNDAKVLLVEVRKESKGLISD